MFERLKLDSQLERYSRSVMWGEVQLERHSRGPVAISHDSFQQTERLHWKMQDVLLQAVEQVYATEGPNL
jgi:hypothetical protein